MMFLGCCFSLIRTWSPVLRRQNAFHKGLKRGLARKPRRGGLFQDKNIDESMLYSLNRSCPFPLLKLGCWCFSGAWMLVLGVFSATAASLSPVTITGFNRDLVIENTASGPPYTGFATNFNTGERNTYYQTGLPGKSFGLSLTGRFTNVTDNTIFQLQSYTASNALVLSSDTGLSSGTLTLSSSTTYSRIAILANSGNGDATGTAALTLRFNDNTTFTTNYYAPDWFNNN